MQKRSLVFRFNKIIRLTIRRGRIKTDPRRRTFSTMAKTHAHRLVVRERENAENRSTAATNNVNAIHGGLICPTSGMWPIGLPKTCHATIAMRRTPNAPKRPMTYFSPFDVPFILPVPTLRIRRGYLPSPASGLFCNVGSPLRYPNEARKRSISITVLV